MCSSIRWKRTCPAYAFPRPARVDGPTSCGSTRASRHSSHRQVGPGYYEFNFSPSLDWAVYRFSAYRDGMSPAEVGRAPEISVRRHDDVLELQSAVRLGHILELRDARELRIALAAVIEDENGGLSYWGLRHAPGKPDFHHPSGFALEVACYEVRNRSTARRARAAQAAGWDGAWLCWRIPPP